MIYFLGGGNMTRAIVTGLRTAKQFHEICIIQRGQEKCAALSTQLNATVCESLPELHTDDVLILAVKPQDMQQACANIVDNGALIVSLAAGLSIATLSDYLHGATRIIRVMPNTPAQVGQGISGLFAPEPISIEDKNTVQTIMSACGMTLWLDSEEKMHAITAISGSGSAYVFYLMNALQKAAQELGFNESIAQQLSLHTFSGAVALALQSSDTLSQLQANVTSKGGTTFAALEVFKQQHIAEHLSQGVAAANQRSRELATQFQSHYHNKDR